MAADAATASSSVTEEELTLTVKWSGKEYTVRVCGDDSVAELKRRICELTNVLPQRQKLLYPKIGNKLSDESLLLSQIPLKSSLKMTMIGYSLIWVILLLECHFMGIFSCFELLNSYNFSFFETCRCRKSLIFALMNVALYDGINNINFNCSFFCYEYVELLKMI